MSVTLTDACQRTLRGAAEVRGVGLFSGAHVTARLLPADPDTGVVFRRADLPGSPPIPARVASVQDRPRRTALQAGSASVETVEHCLAALVGLGIDNALIEVDGPELPAGDGSAMPYAEAIRSLGAAEQAAPRRPLVISEPITVREGEATVAALPADYPGLEMFYVLDYGDLSPIRPQTHGYSLPLKADPEGFVTRIAPARTFTTEAEAEEARKRGLFAHLTPSEMLVIGPTGPIDNAYRFDDEPVRHKLLDLIGDLALVGRPIQGRIVAIRSGHALNHRMAGALLQAAGEREAIRQAAPPAMDIQQILNLLPHRFPMVMVDRVLEMEPDKRAVGIKNVTINEPFFQGHYPARPIMPGVLIVEAMSQLAGLMLSQTLNHSGKIAILLSMEGVKLRRAVVPGDQLVIECEAIRVNARMGESQCRAFVGGELAAEARIRFMMVDPQPGPK